MNKEVLDTMLDHGYQLGDSGGQCTWFIKETIYEDKPAYIVITELNGVNAPESFDVPINIGIMDDELCCQLEGLTFESLTIFLKEKPDV